MSKILCNYSVIYGKVWVVCIFLEVENVLFDDLMEGLGVGVGVGVSFVW